jgi:hypothetical protein
MAGTNLMGERGVAPINLPVEQTAILRRELKGWIGGIEEDLAHPKALPDRNAVLREVEAFRRLLAAVDDGEIALPDEEARAAMAKAAEGHDETVGYERITAAHDAHRALLDVLGGPSRDGRCLR